MITCLFIIVVIETAKGQRLCEADKDPVSEGDPASLTGSLKLKLLHTISFLFFFFFLLLTSSAFLVFIQRVYTYHDMKFNCSFALCHQ